MKNEQKKGMTKAEIEQMKDLLDWFNQKQSIENILRNGNLEKVVTHRGTCCSNSLYYGSEKL